MNPLDALRDIHLPAPPGWWPPAPGWWLLTAILLVATLLVYRRLRLLRRRRRWQRDLQLKLERLGEDAASGAGQQRVLEELSTLLRRVALARHPRERVAGLAGEAWLGFLDQTGGGDGFSAGPGRALARGPFSPAGDTVDLDAVLDVARRWLARNG